MRTRNEAFRRAIYLLEAAGISEDYIVPEELLKEERARLRQARASYKINIPLETVCQGRVLGFARRELDYFYRNGESYKSIAEAHWLNLPARLGAKLAMEVIRFTQAVKEQLAIETSHQRYLKQRVEKMFEAFLEVEPWLNAGGEGGFIGLWLDDHEPLKDVKSPIVRDYFGNRTDKPAAGEK